MSERYTLIFNKERIVDNEIQVLYAMELEVFKNENDVQEWINNPEAVFNTTKVVKEALVRSIASR